MQEAIAVEAVRFAPGDLARMLRRHQRELVAGAREPISERDGWRHMKNEDGSGRLDAVAVEEVEAAITALRKGEPWASVARRLGRVAHFAADANNPLNSSAADREESRYFVDFALYADSARPRFALVSYGADQALSGRGATRNLLDRALERGRQLYPAIGREYRRIDWARGADRFDDRSTAFAVAALAYSHAVSDVARLYRHVWRAGGAPPTRVASLAGERPSPAGSGSAAGASD